MSRAHPAAARAPQRPGADARGRPRRLGKAEKLRAKGENPYAYTWDVSASTAELQEEYKSLANGEV